METKSVIGIASRLSDDQLVTEVLRLTRSERETTASLIAHLGELDARRLYLGAGCPSLFAYCTDVLQLSGHEAYHRIEAARLARRFPLVLQMLADGALNLTTARLLSSHLSAENHEMLLAAAAGKCKREVQLLLARTFPLPDVPSSIRKVPAPRPTSVSAADVGAAPEDAPAVGAVDTSAVGSHDAPSDASVAASSPEGSTGPAMSMGPQPSAPGKSRAVDRPLAADRYEIRFTVNAATREKLRLATDLLRHAVPNGDPAEVVDRALTALLEDLARKKFAAAARPRWAKDAATGTRHVPAHVKRSVWLRDGGRCAFTGKERRRCRERGFLEFHHVRPYAMGGAMTIDNIELRCRAHNAHEAETFYGRRFVPAAKRRPAARLGPDLSGPLRQEKSRSLLGVSYARASRFC